MNGLKIIKATYYVPEIGVEQGTDVTTELSAQIIEGKLFYNGIYNNIFPDNFVNKPKRLKIEIEYREEKVVKFYNENEKINLPNDLGENKKQRWWERTGVQILFVLGSLGSLVGIASLFFLNKP